MTKGNDPYAYLPARVARLHKSDAARPVGPPHPTNAAPTFTREMRARANSADANCARETFHRALTDRGSSR
jgi:hypothetical protein